MNVLSFLWSECSTAALVIDGKVASCCSEERFSRLKNDERFPLRAISACLDSASLDPDDLDLIALPGFRWSPRYVLARRHSIRGMENRLKEQREYWYPAMYEGQTPDYYRVMDEFLDLEQYPGNWGEQIDADRRLASDAHDLYFQEFRRQIVSEHLGVDPNIVRFIHHHEAHASYAYNATRESDAPTLVMTADAWGDDMNATISTASGDGLKRVASSDQLMLGRLYRQITLLLGMKPDEHEYKVMGLAPYSREDYHRPVLDILRNTQYVDGLGFSFRDKPTDLYVYFRERFEGLRFDSIAGGLQAYVEETLSEWVTNAMEATGLRRVVFGGGVAMNVKAMLRIAQLPELEWLGIPPTPSDESLPIGAAWSGMEDMCSEIGKLSPGAKPLHGDAYLGPDLKAEDIQQAVQAARAETGLRVHEDIDNEYVVEQIAHGKVLGRCTGRSEFGARALGNRSLVGDPRSLDTVAKINQTIKSRDFWMPFAPSILSESATEYLRNPKGLPAPYMTLAFETAPEGWRAIPATLHQSDRTCRPQLVDDTVNPSYAKLIRAFAGKADVSAVLNTSFNVHGEPIVQTAMEALDVLMRTDLDLIQIGDYLVEKTPEASEGSWSSG